MAIKKTCDKCGKEIRGRGHTVKGYSNTLLGSFQIFDRDLCDECFKDVRENTLKKTDILKRRTDMELEKILEEIENERERKARAIPTEKATAGVER